MSIKQQPARSLQWPLAVAHEIDFSKEQADVEGVVRGFDQVGKTFVAAMLPIGAVLTGGFAITEGDGAAKVKFTLGGVDVTGVEADAGTASELKVRGVKVPGGDNLLMEVVTGGDSGKLTLYLEYVVLGRSNEVQTH